MPIVVTSLRIWWYESYYDRVETNQLVPDRGPHGIESYYGRVETVALSDCRVESYSPTLGGFMGYVV